MAAEKQEQLGNEFEESGSDVFKGSSAGELGATSPPGPTAEYQDGNVADDEYFDPSEVESAPDEMDAMMDQFLDQMTPNVKRGQLIRVPVVAVKSDGILLDVGDKSEGFVPLREVEDGRGDVTVQVGDVLEVIIKNQDPETGLIGLSYLEAKRRKAWQHAEDCFKNKKPINGKIIRTVKGGVILDIGTTAFLPASQVDLMRIEDFEELIGREVQGYVIEFEPDKRRIIVSRRALLEEERDKIRGEILGKLELGQELDVNVKRLVNFGAFVDVQGLDGLIPRSEISWQRSARPEEYLTVGETVRIRIVEIDRKKGKITLSRKQAMSDPWPAAEADYSIGSRVSGRVVSITNYGAFVRLREGLDGMVHISDMAWDSHGRKPSDFVETGDEVEVQVLALDLSERRISLGMKQLVPDSWSEMIERYPKGSRFKGKVTGLTRFGAFVELESGVEGMVHISDFSWEKRIEHPKDVVSSGDEIEVCILSVDLEKRRVSLGVKQLVKSPMEKFRKSFKAGDLVEGKVVRVSDQGAFIQLAEGVEGFMHVSQIDTDRVENPADILKEGETVRSKVTKIERGNKIALSRKAMLKAQEKKTISTYMRSGSTEDSLLNMGELLEDLQIEDELGLRKSKTAESVGPTEATPSDDNGKISAAGNPSVDPVPGFSEDTAALDAGADPRDHDKLVAQQAPDEFAMDQSDENPPSVMVGESGDSPESEGAESNGSDITQSEHDPSSTEN